MARLNGECLEKSDADTDHTHGHAAPDQQQKAHSETQANLGHNEPAVRGVEAVNGVMPAHRWECGQDKGDHPDAHHCVHCLLLGVTQPESRTTNSQTDVRPSSEMPCTLMECYADGVLCSQV